MEELKTKTIVDQLYTTIHELVMPDFGEDNGQTLCMAIPGVVVESDAAGMKALLDDCILHTQVRAKVPSQSKLSNVYERILDAKVPEGITLTEEQKKEQQELIAYINKKSQIYNAAKREYARARLVYRKEKAAHSSNADLAEIDMEEAEDNWKATGRDIYDAKQGRLRELRLQSPALAFENQSAIVHKTNKELVFIPSNWNAPRENDLAWSELSFSSDQSEHSTKTTTETHAITSSVAKKPGFWNAIGAWFYTAPNIEPQDAKTFSQTVTDGFDNSVDIKCELARVEVIRPWLDLGVMQLEGVSIQGMKPGEISTGEHSPGNAGQMPGVISGFIVARNVEISMKVKSGHEEDLLRIMQKGASESGYGVGPYWVSVKDDVTEKISSHATKDGAWVITLNLGPKIQVIGFINELVSRFPSI